MEKFDGFILVPKRLSFLYALASQPEAPCGSIKCCRCLSGDGTKHNSKIRIVIIGALKFFTPYEIDADKRGPMRV